MEMNEMIYLLAVIAALVVLATWLYVWRKAYQVDLIQKQVPMLHKVLIMGGIMSPTLLPTIANADVKEAAKGAGGQVFTVLMVILIVVGAIMMVIGWIMHSTGGQRWKEQGMSKILIAGMSVAGGAFTMLLIKWVWGVATGAGGGNSWQLPF